MSLAQIDSGALTAVYTDAQRLGIADDGDLKWVNNKLYKFVQIVDLDCSVNECLYPASVDGNSYTIDYTGGSGLTAKVAAIALGTVDISAAPYTWVQICQPGTIGEVRTDDGVAAADPVIGHTVNGECDTMADGEEEFVFGFALEADAGSPNTAAIMFG